MAAVVHHDGVTAENVRNGDRGKSGSGLSQSTASVGQQPTQRRIRKAVGMAE